MNSARLGILVFALAVIAGPLYTVPDYSVLRNLVSELGAQNTPRNWIMVSAFIALGAGVIATGVRHYSRELLPFIAFGAFMALAGLFGHKPIGADIPYVSWLHAAHSALATAAGISITAGLMWQAFIRRTTSRRILAALLAMLCLVLPLLMLAFPEVQGAIQRVMYLLIFAWLWVYYPVRAHAERRALAEVVSWRCRVG